MMHASDVRTHVDCQTIERMIKENLAIKNTMYHTGVDITSLKISDKTATFLRNDCGYSLTRSGTQDFLRW